MLTFELSIVWPKKNRDFMKKIQQLPKTGYTGLLNI